MEATPTVEWQPLHLSVRPAAPFDFALTARVLRRSGDVDVRTFCGPAAMPGIHWSDHASFRRLGVPAAMLTDTAFHRNPHYHRGTDLPETLDEARMERVAAMLATAVRSRWTPTPA